MKKQFSKDSIIFNFFKEYYLFIQNYAIPEDDDSFWDAAIKEGETLGRKYKGKFYSDLIMAHLNELQRNAKESKG